MPRARCRSPSYRKSVASRDLGSRRAPGERPRDVPDVDSVEQHRECGSVDLEPERAFGDLRESKSPLGKPLVIDDESVPVPEEDFHAIASPTEEDEEMTFIGIELPGVSDEADEAIVTAAEVDGLGGEVDANTRGQSNHRARMPETTAATYSAGVPDSKRTRTPSQRSSTADARGAGVVGSRTASSTNRGATALRLSAPSFQRHQDSVRAFRRWRAQKAESGSPDRSNAEFHSTHSALFLRVAMCAPVSRSGSHS